MPITVVVSDTLVEFAPSGILTGAMVVAAIREHYRNLGTRDVLWDLSLATANEVSAPDHDAIVNAVSESRTCHGVCRTAFVIPSANGFAGMWSYCRDALERRVPVEYSVFGRRERALSWLNARKP